MNNLFRDFKNGLVEVQINNSGEYDAFMNEIRKRDVLMLCGWDDLPWEHLTSGTIYIKVNSDGDLVYRADTVKIISFKEFMNSHEK